MDGRNGPKIQKCRATTRNHIDQPICHFETEPIDGRDVISGWPASSQLGGACLQAKAACLRLARWRAASRRFEFGARAKGGPPRSRWLSATMAIRPDVLARAGYAS